MLYYLTVAGLVAHTVFWGAGLAWWVTPRRWRAWAWVFMPAAGIALQSAVVWAGAHTTWAGTNRYAWWSELVPLGLLVTAGLGRRIVRPRGLLRGSAAGLVVVAGLLAGWLLLSPLAERGAWTLTTASLGSCDQADYAAGARVLQEFSSEDRTGFLGLPEVTRVRSTEYFFDYFVRQNHFTPAALIAHHGAIFGLQSYQLVSAMAVALLLMSVPVGLWLARVMVGVRGGWLAALGAVVMVSPLHAYAVHHGALGQLLAMQGIALLTVAGFAASRDAGGAKNAWRYAPLVFIAVWLLAGSYNFILTIAFAPLGAWLAFEAVRRRTIRPLGRVATMLGVTVVGCALIFWGRFAGVVERFSLLEQYNFGWTVAALSPEAWLGIVRDAELRAWPGAGRVALAVVAGGVALLGLALAGRRGGLRRASIIAALTLPVLGGWAVLMLESRVRANASYDAYKTLMVFYPGLLAGLLGALAWVPRERGPWRGVALLGMTALLALNLVPAQRFRAAMVVPPLRVDRSLLELAAVENDPRVASLNLRVEDFWARLWANTLLIKKAQYFVTDSYEARWATPLRGEWDLRDGLIRPVPASAEESIAVNARFGLTRAGFPGQVEGWFERGWHAEEGVPGQRWRWAGEEAQVWLHNPAATAVVVELVARGKAISPRELRARVEQHALPSVPLGVEEQRVSFGEVLLQPGRTALVFSTSEPPVSPPGDGRALTFALYGLEIRAVSRASGQPTSSALK